MSARNRLSNAFAAAREQGRAALVTFVTAGDGPTADILDALVEGGADVIELGMLLADLLGVRDAASIGFTAHALANAFADLALPLEEAAGG